MDQGLAPRNRLAVPLNSDLHLLERHSQMALEKKGPHESRDQPDDSDLPPIGEELDNFPGPDAYNSAGWELPD